MTKELITAQEIKDSIMNRILRGQYALGDRLPSVRELASELGANRNTVNKAYQLLVDMGVIESGSSSRTGFFVKNTTIVDQNTRGDFVEYFRQQAVQLIWQAMAGGMSPRETLDQLRSAVDQVYSMSKVNLLFCECNALDSQEMGQHLAKLLNLDIQSSLIDELRTASSTAESYDLIITTFHHLAQVTHQVGEDNSDKIVAIDTRLTSDSLLEIARLRGTKCGVVCSVPHTTHMLKHILHSYYPDRHIDAVVIDDTDAVLAVIQDSDHLIVTHTCVDQLRTITDRPADVIVNFLVDEQSVQYLKRRVKEVQTRKTESLYDITIGSV